MPCGRRGEPGSVRVAVIWGRVCYHHPAAALPGHVRVVMSGRDLGLSAESGRVGLSGSVGVGGSGGAEIPGGDLSAEPVQAIEQGQGNERHDKPGPDRRSTIGSPGVHH